jgi:hypothetical protein
MIRVVLWGALLLAACDDDDGDIRGPFTGDVHRFYLTSLELPIDNTTTLAFGADLDGDGKVNNALGTILTALGVAGDLTPHGPDMIASGAIASYLEIQADDLENDPTVGVTFFGADGDAATVMGGAIENGAFVSNRTRTTKVPGAAIARLPVFEDADPVALPLAWVEIDLGTDGAGGYDAVLRGGLPAAEASMVAYEGVLEMMNTNPQGHTVFQRVLDADMDGTLTIDEVASSSLLTLLLRPDVELDGEDHLSFAFGAHFAPAPPTTTPAAPCADRVKDGDESDVDCGGTNAACPRCPGGATCTVPEDCQTGGCENGRCRTATCTDGVRDGFEGDVDCGAGCPNCTDGQRCAANPDCTSNSCTATVGTPGVCVP